MIVQNQVTVLVIVIAVVVLEVIEGVMVVVPGADDDSRIPFGLKILEAVKSWSNPVGDNPLEMMCRMNLWRLSKMEV